MEGYVTPGGPYFDAELNFTPEPPGTVFVYSGAGVALLGCLVEQINPDGLSFEEYCRAYVFDPLQMPASSFLLSNIDSADLVTNYRWTDPNYYPLVQGNAAHYPSNGLRTNARELSRFMLAYLQGGELHGQRILDAATVDSMLTEQYPDIVPADIDQGLLWRGREWESVGCYVWGHWGGGYPARAGLWISGDEGIGVIAMTNCGGNAEMWGVYDINDMEIRHAAEWAAAGVGVPDDLPETPALVYLGPCYPNPFNPLTTISLSFARDRRAEVGVYDLLGHRVSVLANGEFTAGAYSLTWNGLDAAGRAMPSGTYIVRLETESGVEARKMLLLR
jgi:CubicO group peptidase (beta-lactamase class C family)